MLTKLTLFALISKCPLLSEIKMESIGRESVENSDSLMDFDVYPQLKSLCLANNSWLKDEIINTFPFIFPNLQLLDLSYCTDISEEGIAQVLRRCCKIRHLNLSGLKPLKPLRINFKVLTLEVLYLSNSGIDDSSLYMISKNCFGLLQLELRYCCNITEKGVKHVVEKCTQLREINLQGCNKVAADVVDLMVSIRPSLRKIIPPPRFHFSESRVNHFLLHGCLIQTVWK
jgi:F-box/leucine-rich repeat protein 2/20